MHFTPKRVSGFTLIELLVVIGIIGLFIGSFSAAVSGGNINTKVDSTQFQITSLLRQARTVALTRSTETRVIVNLAPNNSRYLTELAVIWRDNTDGVWILNSEVVVLRDGVGILPESSVPSAPGVTWPGKVKSVFTGTASVDSPLTGQATYGYVGFSPRGTAILSSGGQSPQLAIGPYRPSADGSSKEFHQPDASVGVLLRAYGTPIELRFPAAFPN
ncbi:MAG: Tfp pilus assembly protein FimT/FimU [Puniceicoccaceae bacterium]